MPKKQKTKNQKKNIKTTKKKETIATKSCDEVFYAFDTV